MLPKRLFSHNDQQSTWISFAPEGSQLGWGGHFGDAAVQANANMENIFSQISVFGDTVFLAGERVISFRAGVGGVQSILLLDRAGQGVPVALAPIFRDHFTSAGSERTNLLEHDYIDCPRVSFDANDLLESALRSAPSLATSFPSSFPGSQLRAVARTMSVRDALGASRQVFSSAWGASIPTRRRHKAAKG
jgi:hypothetical protein